MTLNNVFGDRNGLRRLEKRDEEEKHWFSCATRSCCEELLLTPCWSRLHSNHPVRGMSHFHSPSSEIISTSRLLVKLQADWIAFVLSAYLLSSSLLCSLRILIETFFIFQTLSSLCLQRLSLLKVFQFPSNCFMFSSLAWTSNSSYEIIVSRWNQSIGFRNRPSQSIEGESFVCSKKLLKSK